MNIKTKLLPLSLLFSTLFVPAAFATHDNCEIQGTSQGDFSAYERCVEANDNHSASTQESGSVEELSGPSTGLKSESELSNNQSLSSNPIIQRLDQIVNFLSAGVIIVITISVVISGIQYITSNGDPQKTQKAVARLTSAGIALFLFVFGWAILQWIIPGDRVEFQENNTGPQTNVPGGNSFQ